MTLTIAILSIAFVALVVLGFPISFALAISSLVAVLYQGGIPLNLIVHRAVMGVDSFVLLAIPLFIFAGLLMEHAGISERLILFARSLFGRFRGGLAMTVVFGTMLQSGVSGSTVADVSAISAMTLKPLERAGYAKPYSLALIGASSAFSILIPPCILMVILAAVANTSVVALFAAGLLPSALLGVMVLGLVHFQARIYAMPRDEVSSLRTILAGAKDASLALGIPLGILAGIRFGVATVTELAALTVVYALLVGFLVYRTLSWKVVIDSLVETAITTGVIVMLMGFATIFSYVIATQGLPQAFADWLRSSEISATGVLVVSALIFIFIGSVLEGAPAVLIFVPLLLPLVRALNIDMVHWLTVVVLASGIGLFLPPSGLAVLIACSIGDIKMEKLVKPIMPFLAVLFLGLLILIFVPVISTVVPQWLELPY